MCKNVLPNLTLVLLFDRSETECGKGLLIRQLVPNLYNVSGVGNCISWLSCRRRLSGNEISFVMLYEIGAFHPEMLWVQLTNPNF